MRRVMRGGDEIDVEGALALKIEACIAKVDAFHRVAKRTVSDHRVLTVRAAERAMGEEHGSTARRTADGRLFPKMQRRACDENIVSRAARSALPRRAVRTAPTRAQIARPGIEI